MSIHTTVARGRIMRLRPLCYAASVAMLAGLLVGVAWGMGARGAMRLIAMAAHHLPAFSMEGTLMIMLVGGFLGTVGGLMFAGLRPAMPGHPLLQGLLLALLHLSLTGLLIYNGFIAEARSMHQVPLTLALFVPLLLLLGFGTALLRNPLDRWLARRGRVVQTLVLLFAPLFLLGCLVLIARSGLS